MAFDHLYNFKPDAWHCKFFHWAWGVWPNEKFKTMCPYFWASIGTVIILPITAIIFFFIWVFRTRTAGKGADFMRGLAQACIDANQSRKQRKSERKDRRREKRREDLLLKIRLVRHEIFQEYQDFIYAYNKWWKSTDNEDLLRDVQKLAYDFRNRLSRLKSANDSSFLDNVIRNTNGDEKDKYLLLSEEYDDTDEEANPYNWRNVSNWFWRIHDKYDEYEKYLKETKWERYSESLDESPPKKWVSIIIASIAGLVLLGGVGALLYAMWYLVSTAVTYVIAKWIYFLAGAGILTAAGFAGWGIYRFFACWGREILEAIRDFFVWIWEKLLLPIFKPFGKIKLLAWIIKGFMVVGNMIYATYKQYCPMITWEETKSES